MKDGRLDRLAPSDSGAASWRPQTIMLRTATRCEFRP